MYHNNKELWLSFFACVLITAVYTLVALWYRAIPAAGSLFGHLIGIIGFVFMLMAETLYSFRKRSRRAHWGSMQSWLQFHIFTGLVGPFMVLLHSSWKFNGLAGASMLLTILIVISGFVGRYIYTLIPRSLDGSEMPASGVQTAVLARARRLMAIWHAVHVPIGIALFAAAFIHAGAALYYYTLLR